MWRSCGEKQTIACSTLPFDPSFITKCHFNVNVSSWWDEGNGVGRGERGWIGPGTGSDGGEWSRMGPGMGSNGENGVERGGGM